MRNYFYILFFLLSCQTSLLFAQDITTHTVQAEETLYSISRKYNVSVKEITTANNIQDNVIKIGQTLTIPAKDVQNTANSFHQVAEDNANTKAVYLPEGSAPVYYRAKDGETLRSVAFSYQVLVDSLSVWNGIMPDDLLTEGQQIVVSLNGNVNQFDKAAIEVQSKSYADLTKEEAKTYDIPMQKVERGNGQIVDLPSNTSKLMALHRKETVGAYIKVINPNNDRVAVVRVVAPLPENAIEEGIIIRVSEQVAKKIGVVNPDFKVRVEYNQ
ncbi:LysM peptidoglycan-binding domain-containing protein [Flammeovirga sp. SubArs3]|uniref:lytic transglycosylase n=1 Tax=Flammeovirga sp. SubArs3 TaxID=2995316 RepID=UPI00248D2E52|nr:LysM peptidoglycan-binding domain-containing protein [Flammeovirga sp. SubArs3]